MKILMIAPQPYFEPRGTPISVNQRLAALSKLGHRVDLLTYHIGEDTPMKGLSIHRTPDVPFIKSVRIGPSPAKLALDVLLVIKAIALLIGSKYDVIHTHEEAAFFGMPLAKIFHCLHFYDMHSSLPRQLENFKYADVGPIIALFEFLEKLVLRSADAVITIGEDLDAYVLSVHSEANVHRIENRPVLSGSDNGGLREIIELGEKLKSAGRTTVVYTGSFERYQGLEMLVQSVADLHEQEPRVSLILVGGRPDQVEAMQESLERAGIAESSMLVGNVPLAEAFAYLDIADVLVSPRIEGTSVPLKIYSYLSAGKPILASRIPAHTELLDDTRAVLFEPTRAGLARGLRTILGDQELREKLSRNAARFAERQYSSSNYLSRVEALYQDGRQNNAVVARTPQSVEK